MLYLPVFKKIKKSIFYFVRFVLPRVGTAIVMLFANKIDFLFIYIAFYIEFAQNTRKTTIFGTELTGRRPPGG